MSMEYVWHIKVRVFVNRDTELRETKPAKSVACFQLTSDKLHCAPLAMRRWGEVAILQCPLALHI